MREHENDSPGEVPGQDRDGEWVYRRKGVLRRAGGRVARFRDQWVEDSAPTDESVEAQFADRPTTGLSGWQREQFWPWAKTPAGRVVLAVVAVVAVVVWMVMLGSIIS
ncbi:hypothetical protein [Nesterenkonia marinintestina]|uniref:hypothetical protein n=1 Tax=Nesterenkonia marinintestina TaxID=2979865 RepID=UPI0021C0F328|nr:hypothetical protein [Nesterenkonia sp. GX14115]